jgi:hypothetical protein
VASQVTSHRWNEPQSLGFRAIAVGVQGENDGKFRARLAQGANAHEKAHAGARDGAEEAPPREHDAHAVRESSQLLGEILERRSNVEKIPHVRAERAVRELTGPGGVGVDAEKEALRLV